MRALDIEAVQAFVLTADLKSFTRAAEAMDTTQSAVSLKIKRLEDGLGRRLLERTPRLVRLSADGHAFLEPARNLVAAHHGAVGSFGLEQRRLVVGISHHIVGHELPLLLKRMSGAEPRLVLEMRVSTSREVLDEFDRGVDRCRDRAQPRQPEAERRNHSGGSLRLDGRARFRASCRRGAAAGDPGRALQRAQHGDRCAEGCRHRLDRSVRRRRHRHDGRCGFRGACGRRPRPPRRAFGHHRCRRQIRPAATASRDVVLYSNVTDRDTKKLAEDACRHHPRDGELSRDEPGRAGSSQTAFPLPGGRRWHSRPSLAAVAALPPRRLRVLDCEPPQ